MLTLRNWPTAWLEFGLRLTDRRVLRCVFRRARVEARSEMLAREMAVIAEESGGWLVAGIGGVQ